MLQQAFAEGIVSLSLRYHIDTEELVSICGLTRLTSLHLLVPQATDGKRSFSSLTALQQLRSLGLSGQWGEDQSTTLKGVRWWPLTQLTHLILFNIEGIYDAAGTLPQLHVLDVTCSYDRPRQRTLDRLHSLLHLSSMYFRSVDLGPQELDTMQHVDALRDLCITDLASFEFELYPGGGIDYCHRLRRLTMLTSLCLCSSG